MTASAFNNALRRTSRNLKVFYQLHDHVLSNFSQVRKVSVEDVEKIAREQMKQQELILVRLLPFGLQAQALRLRIISLLWEVNSPTKETRRDLGQSDFRKNLREKLANS